MTTLTLSALREKLLDPEWAAARITVTYQPSGGPGARIFPPTFPVDSSSELPYLLEQRVWEGEPRQVVLLDQVPSQANRCEEAMAAAWRGEQIRLPMLRLLHEGAAHFEIIGLEAPHRAFDAYWRDAMLDGEKFDRTEIGKALQAVSQQDATALVTYDPGTLVYGGWNSYRNKGRQAKFPRLYSSEIIGWDPVLGARKAGRMDPANLTGSCSEEGDDWTYSSNAANKAKKAKKLSEIGHGNIRPNTSHGGVTITEATRTAVFSLTATRRIGFGDLHLEGVEAARSLLVTIGLLGDRLAFGDSGLWLRSGCDLVMVAETLEWVGRGGVLESFTLSGQEAVELYAEAVQEAIDAKVPLHLTPIDLKPSKALEDAIDFTLTKAKSAGE
ncbi:MAG: type I-U CRISPR-associated RAMP protein Csb1/Cas7u [Actinomycetaceae bacterium]|nr:type I-U CRISPR-associated RAMP protein Csb1/Cas7u [Actinomycetaceae bacterium]